MTYYRNNKWAFFFILAGLSICGIPTAAFGQFFFSPTEQNWAKPLLFQDFTGSSYSENTTVRQSSTPRLRMFGMPAGFLANPIGLEDEDDAKISSEMAAAGIFNQGEDFKFVQVAMGMDNPFFDLRRPGNVGGVGYYQVYSQVQVVDTGKTSMCLNLQTYSPAGLQWGGLANGTTYFCPAVSWFHDLGEGTALQGFVSENLNAGSGWEDNWNRKMFYGLAWQCPLTKVSSDGDQVFFFVQALGKLHYDPEHSGVSPAMSVLPGIQWRMGDNCWLSLGGSRNGLLSCSWQF